MVHSEYISNHKLWEGIADYCAEEGLGMQMHLACTEAEVEDCYYSAVFADGDTKEWCMDCDDNGIIRQVRIGGENAWYMLGHTFWDETFSRTFLSILEAEYDRPETAELLWESIYINHLPQLTMYIRKYEDDVVPFTGIYPTD